MSYEQLEMMIELDKNNLVVQSNLMIYGCYDFSALEQKIILILISTIKKNDTQLKALEFQVKDLANILGVSPELLYRDLPKLCKNIMEKVIEIKQQDGSWMMFNLISYAEYKKKEGRIILDLNQKAKPFLLFLQEYFTTFKLGDALDLSGKYSIRLYQLTKGCLNIGKLTYTVDDFRKTLKIDKKKTYNNFGKINEKIISPAVEEINAKSNILVTYSTKRVGRKIGLITFNIQEKSKANKTVKTISKQKDVINNKSFNNFKAREYDYDKLEAGLVFGDEVYMDDIRKK